MTGVRDDDVLAQLWRAVEHVAKARVAVLEDGLLALQAGAPDAGSRAAAAFDECHKLVGSLDSYSRTGGSALALRAAELFALPAPDLDVLADVVGRLRRTVDGPA